jgi:hypothetical protein
MRSAKFATSVGMSKTVFIGSAPPNVWIVTTPGADSLGSHRLQTLLLRTTSREQPIQRYKSLGRGLAEGIVSKRVDGTYRSGPCPVWIKVRNPASVAVQRERSEKWNR